MHVWTHLRDFWKSLELLWIHPCICAPGYLVNKVLREKSDQPRRVPFVDMLTCSDIVQPSTLVYRFAATANVAKHPPDRNTTAQCILLLFNKAQNNGSRP